MNVITRIMTDQRQRFQDHPDAFVTEHNLTDSEAAILRCLTGHPRTDDQQLVESIGHLEKQAVRKKWLPKYRESFKANFG